MNSRPLYRSLIMGSFGFCMVSLIVYATVAFGERWMYQNLGLWGAYAAWTILFILGGALVLSPIVQGKVSTVKFSVIFCAAFFSYAIGWIVSYFLLRNAMGEWIGSFAGCLLLTLVFIRHTEKNNYLGFIECFLVIFSSNSVGYFLGRDIFALYTTKIGMISWGLTYGLGLGLGLGYILHYYKSSA